MRSLIEIALCGPCIAYEAMYECTTKPSKAQEARLAKPAKVPEVKLRCVKAPRIDAEDGEELAIEHGGWRS